LTFFAQDTGKGEWVKAYYCVAKAAQYGDAHKGITLKYALLTK